MKSTLILLTSILAAISAKAQDISPYHYAVRDTIATDTTATDSIAAAPALRTSGQGGTQSVALPEVLPKSPEAEAFLRYGADITDDYTGTNRVEIPLYTVRSHDIEIPIALTYRATGIRVDQEASWVGLGWNLSVGACVNRIALGIPDGAYAGNSPESAYAGYYDTYGTGYVTAELNKGDLPADFIADLIHGHGQPDLYSVNLPDAHFLFYCDRTDGGAVKIIGTDPSCCRVERTTAGWTVTDGRGRVWDFNHAEYTEGTPTTPSFVSAWFVSGVSSPSGGDVWFGYTPQTEVAVLAQLQERRDFILDGGTGGGLASYPYGTAERTLSHASRTFSRYLTTAGTADETVSFHLGPRSDMRGAPRLDSLTITPAAQGRGRRIHFNYGYFDSASNSTGGDFLAELGMEVPDSLKRLRLKLLSVSDASEPGTPVTHAFHYDESGTLPMKSSCARDFWGYYNGQENTMAGSTVHTLLPAAWTCYMGVSMPQALQTMAWKAGGAVRLASAAHARIWTLNGVTWPTGGRTDYTYSLHEFSALPCIPDIAQAQRASRVLQDWNRTDGNDTEVALFTVSGGTHRGMLECTIHGTAAHPLATLTGTVIEVFAQNSTLQPRYTGHIEVVPGPGGSQEWKGYIPVVLPAGSYVMRCLLPASVSYGSGVYATARLHTWADYPMPSRGAGLRLASSVRRDAGGAALGRTDYSYTNDGGGSSGVRLMPVQYHKLVTCGVYNCQTTTVNPSTGQTMTQCEEAVYHAERFTASPQGAGNVLTEQVSPGHVGYARVQRHECDTLGSVLRTTVSEYRVAPATERMAGCWSFESTGGGALLMRATLGPVGDTLAVERHMHTGSRSMMPGPVTAEDRYFIYGTAPDALTGPNIAGLNQYRLQSYPYTWEWSKHTGTTVTEYTPQGKRTTSTACTWDTSVYAVTEQTVTDAAGNGTRRVTRYAADSQADGAALLRSRGMPAVPVEELLYRTQDGAETLVSSRRKQYGLFHGAFILPRYEWLSAGGAEERRLEYGYDSRGNLAWACRDSLERAVWLWSYGWRHPVAEVRGATMQQVAAWAGGQQAIDALGNATSQQAVAAQLAALRASLAGKPALPTTLIWEPGKGVTGVTTPDSTVTHYQYDGAGRLTAAADAQGSVISSYAYHYAGAGVQPAAGGNWIRTTVMNDAPGANRRTAVTWHDGLGRPVLAADDGAGDGTAALYTANAYDALGREALRTLPLPLAGEPAFDAAEGIAAALTQYHGDSRPWEETSHDALDRHVETTGAGAAWDGHPETAAYGANTAQEVRRYGMDAGRLERRGWYAPGTLRRETRTDSDGRVLTVFTDTEGNKVLERKGTTTSTAAETYFVYDTGGRLACVLPPAAADALDSPAGSWQCATDDDMRRWCYCYEYDGRGRVVRRRLPGQEWAEMRYDKADRLTFIQDGLQRQDGKAEFRLCDKYGRLCVRGLCGGLLDAAGSAATAEYTGQGPYGGYTVTGASIPGDVTLLEADYYDGYAFLGAETDSVQALLAFTGQYAAAHAGGRGRRTGRRVWTADGGGCEAQATYYDDRGRVIQQRRAGTLRGASTDSWQYSFTGKPLRRAHTQSGLYGKTVSEEYTYAYHPKTDALLTVTHSINSSTPVTLASYTYDALGRTATKTVGGIETVSYGYNIRSWPTRIESAKFTELMGYNAAANGMTVSYPQWGGNIAAMLWRHGNGEYRGYELDYDDHGRLANAWYGGGLTFASTDDYYEEYFNYDKMGNITNLMRGGRLDDNSYGLIDDLDMEYDGNQLTRVYDYASDDDPTYAGAMQFTDNADETTEYEYDANGNLTKDLNANISSIQYNCLNLPSRVTVASGGSSSLQHKVMDITYNADGEKLYVSPSLVMEIWPVLSPLQGGGAVQQQGGALPGGDPGPGTGTAPFDDPAIQDLSTRYCGNVVFERGEIARVLTDEGYITFAPNGKPMRHYYLRDHLGNIRVVFNQAGTVEQRNDYYPSGALMATSTGGSVQPYKYNGKELERMNGLDLYDYGARWMDSKIGARFTTMDPMCEKYYDISPYAYCSGNPVNRIDPDGREWYIYITGNQSYINIAVNLSYSTNINNIESYKDAISNQISQTFSDVSNGTVHAKVSFYDNNVDIQQSLFLGELDANIAGLTTNDNSSVNIIDRNHNLKSAEAVGIDTLHELLHTIGLLHPFENPQTADTQLIHDYGNNYISTPTTDKKIINNAMNYESIYIDGEKCNDLRCITKGQLELVIKEVIERNK